jgi:hypothetical protein
VLLRSGRFRARALLPATRSRFIILGICNKGPLSRTARLPIYSDARMIVSTRRVFAGSLESSLPMSGPVPKLAGFV